ncbi:MAG: caspase family protein [Proteobacteria bacterium]|nr:caspase family protein [Pseudomonadota bacterium]
MGTDQGSRRRRLATAGLAALAIALYMPAAAAAETLIFQAASSGQQTLDEGEGGGNPFASALIEVLGLPKVTLGEMPGAMRDLTTRKSAGAQLADVPKVATEGAWTLAPGAAGERRRALVIVVADYAKAGANSLPGAARDATRIANALRAAGFDVESALDLDLGAMRARLAEFSTRSAGADVAAVYATGHGVEVDGTQYMLAGDFPVAEGTAALKSHALTLADLAAAARAKRVNLVFWGGCRDNPLGK